MKDGVGEGSTREDHMDIASQLFAAYAGARDARDLASVIGEEELSPMDQTYLKFAEAFEQEYVSQGEYENRSIGQTLDLAWEVAGILPRSELAQVSDKLLDKYYERQAPEGEEGSSEGE
jgi:V/A-type H+-transporting ATPase subunit B